jgi:hypothetical protein
MKSVEHFKTPLFSHHGFGGPLHATHVQVRPAVASELVRRVLTRMTNRTSSHARANHQRLPRPPKIAKFDANRCNEGNVRDRGKSRTNIGNQVQPPPGFRPASPQIKRQIDKCARATIAATAVLSSAGRLVERLLTASRMADTRAHCSRPPGYCYFASTTKAGYPSKEGPGSTA